MLLNNLNNAISPETLVSIPFENQPEFKIEYGNVTLSSIFLSLANTHINSWMIATLMDLVGKDVVRLIKNANKSIKIDDYLFKLLKNKDEPLDKHQKMLIKWLFSYSSFKKILSLNTLKQKAKDRKFAEQYEVEREKWKAEVINKAESLQYIEVRRKGMIRRKQLGFMLAQIIFFFCYQMTTTT